MISHKHKCIFVHIPKTGGSSIENVFLGKSVPPKYQYSYKKRKYHFKINEQHAFPHEMRRCYGITSWSEYFKFIIVRNPWERFVSYRFHMLNHNLLHKDISFNSFVNMFFDKNKNPIKKEKHRAMIEPCMSWITDDIDYIMRLESIDLEFNIVCDKIGIPRQKPPHIGKTNHKHYTEYYNEETKQIIAEKYAKDIEHFGYGFGGEDE
jgi:chondroitin 4-sulfotransferase 11